MVMASKIERWNMAISNMADWRTNILTDMKQTASLSALTYNGHWYEPQREKTYLLTRALNEDSNQPAHLRSLIRVFEAHMKLLCVLGYPKCAQWIFRSDCASAQSDLNLLWTHMSAGTFSDDLVHMSWTPEHGNLAAFWQLKQLMVFQQGYGRIGSL